MGKASPIVWGLWGPLIALCNNMLQWCALLGAMNVNAPPPHHLLSSLKQNVSTMPTKGQFTEAGSPVGTSNAALKDWSNTFKCPLWVLLVTSDLVFISYLFLHPGKSVKDKFFFTMTGWEGGLQWSSSLISWTDTWWLDRHVMDKANCTTDKFAEQGHH